MPFQEAHGHVALCPLVKSTYIVGAKVQVWDAGCLWGGGGLSWVVSKKVHQSPKRQGLFATIETMHLGKPG